MNSNEANGPKTGAVRASDVAAHPTRRMDPEYWLSGGVRHPEIVVQLSGTDGNAFAVLGAVKGALRDAKLSDVEISEFVREATTGDYDHLLGTAMRWVDVR